jgi:hypothetical protein
LVLNNVNTMKYEVECTMYFNQFCFQIYVEYMYYFWKEYYFWTRIHQKFLKQLVPKNYRTQWVNLILTSESTIMMFSVYFPIRF